MAGLIAPTAALRCIRTNARAAAAARAFDFRPRIQGRMTQVHRMIVARDPAHEAWSICRGVFVWPTKRAGPFVARFAHSGIGVMNQTARRPGRRVPAAIRRIRSIGDASL